MKEQKETCSGEHRVLNIVNKSKLKSNVEYNKLQTYTIRERSAIERKISGGRLLRPLAGNS
jgi:hypothetical protein